MPVGELVGWHRRLLGRAGQRLGYVVPAARRSDPGPDTGLRRHQVSCLQRRFTQPQTLPARYLEQPNVDRNRIFDADPISHFKKVMHCVVNYVLARLTFAVTAFNLLIRWRNHKTDEHGFMPLSIAKFNL